MQHLLKILDISSKETEEILNLADQLKYEQKHGMSHPSLEGRSVAAFFARPSLRSCLSLEVGVGQLGGSCVFMSEQDMPLSKREPVEDVARVVSRLCAAAAVYGHTQENIEELAHYGTVPVINLGSDFASPCTALADLMTIREFKGRLDGLKACFIGANVPMMNSAIVACLKTRMNVAVACPEGFDPDGDVLDYAAKVGHFEMYRDPRGAARGADVVMCSAWTRDADARAYNLMHGFAVNNEVMRYAKPDAIVLHSLPARRGEEITADILEEHSIEIFEAVENRMHVQKALLDMLVKR